MREHIQSFNGYRWLTGKVFFIRTCEQKHKKDAEIQGRSKTTKEKQTGFVRQRSNTWQGMQSISRISTAIDADGESLLHSKQPTSIKHGKVGGFDLREHHGHSLSHHDGLTTTAFRKNSRTLQQTKQTNDKK
jgi:hypothetical protein